MGNRLQFETNTYRSMASSLETIGKWLEDLGFPVGATRLGEYKRDLERFAHAIDENEIAGILREEGTQSLINSLFESAEFRLIYDVLSARMSPELERRLREFIGGPPAYRDENSSSSNRARSIGFELNLGARLLLAGLPVAFHPDGDLRFRFNGHQFYVECKRPLSVAKVPRRVAEAQKQLLARYETSEKPELARGLIGISATRIVNPGGGYFETESRETLDRGMSAVLDQFVQDHGHAWQQSRDPRTIGCMLEFRAFVTVLSENTPTTGGDLALTMCDGLTADDERLLKALAAQVSEGGRP